MAYQVSLIEEGITLTVEEGESVLDVALKAGINLPYSCRAGSCSSCVGRIIEGEVDQSRGVALEPEQRDMGYALLCISRPLSDLKVKTRAQAEMLNLGLFDDGFSPFDLLNSHEPELPFISTYRVEVREITPLTHDIRSLGLKQLSPQPMVFRSGQYVDIHIPGTTVTRSYSMANPSSQNDVLKFMIKLYPGGKFSTYLEENLQVGDELEVTGPYGNFFLRNDNTEMIMVGGGSGMAPLWSILNELAETGSCRRIRFFYGVRAKRDLFYLEEIARLQKKLPNFEFIPALSDPQSDDHWRGEIGFIHEVVDRRVDAQLLASGAQAYLCGPAPMIDASVKVLESKGIKSSNIFFDKFTANVR